MSRATKLGPGGTITTNNGYYNNYNKYNGQRGIVVSNISNHNALKRLASFCQRDCIGSQTIPIIPETIPIIPETILHYNTTQGTSFIWSGVTFILNTTLTSFSYSATITSIPAIQVPSRTNLINVTIGNLVTTIGNNAFFNCIALKSIIIPNSVVTIGNTAFFSCSALTYITIPNSVITIGISAFQRLQTRSITIPNSVTSIGASAFRQCTEAIYITLPSNHLFTTININTFNACFALMSITIPNSVTTINASAFESCRALTSITIPNSVTTIGANAFKDCISLENIYISNATAINLGNLFSQTWSSPGNILPPNFYNAPSTVYFRLPIV